MTARPIPCDHWLGDERRHCGSTQSVRQYLPGYRCPNHTPARLAGRPEPPTPHEALA